MSAEPSVPPSPRAGSSPAARAYHGDHTDLSESVFHGPVTGKTQSEATGRRAIAFGHDNRGLLITGDNTSLTLAGSVAQLPPVTEVAARDLLAELLPIRERVLGPEHPDTLTTRHDLVRWDGEAEKP